MAFKTELSEELYEEFFNLLKKHMNVWESEERKAQHSLGNIEKVEYDPNKELFYVHFKATDHFQKTWYHYDTKRGVWW